MPIILNQPVFAFPLALLLSWTPEVSFSGGSTNEEPNDPADVLQFALASAGGLVAVQTTRSQPQRPNFVFILTDDQRWDSLGVMGHPFANTPNMDGLSREGIHFRNAFVITLLCSPSWASFLTGQYAHFHGLRDNFGEIRPQAGTFATVLKRAGSATGFFGKWHMGYQENNHRPEFDRWVSSKGQGQYFDLELNINGRHRKVSG